MLHCTFMRVFGLTGTLVALSIIKVAQSWVGGLVVPKWVSKCAAAVSLCTVIASPVLAAPAPVDMNDPMRLVRGLKEITYLLQNWEKKTTLCNFGELKNELLAEGQESELFEAAKKGSLWDKDESTMDVMCKRDPEVVRAFVGLTNENMVLKNAEKLMLKANIVDLVDSDEIEAYEENVDAFIRAVSEVDQLSYAARTDHDSTETFSRDKGGQSIKALAGTDYLSQSKIAVVKAQKALDGIVKELHLI